MCYICVHFRRALECQAKQCFQICHHIGSYRFAHCALNPLEATQAHLKCTNTDIKEKAQSTSNYLDTLQGAGESASRASIQTAAQRVDLSLSHFDVVGHH